MLGYVARRLIAAVPTLLIAFTVCFLIVHATPGSPWDVGANRPVDPAVKANLDAKYHLNEPLAVQYVDYLAGALQGNLGPSYSERTLTVDQIIAAYLPTSLEIGASAMALAILLGLLLGGIAAANRGGVVDGLITTIATVGISLPTYAIVSILIVVLGVDLRLVPAFGWDHFFSINSVVPIASLAVAPTAALARYFRSSMLEASGEDYVLLARAKGLPERVVMIRHVARNALIPAITVAGAYTSTILVGSFFVESIAGVPGFGKYFVVAIEARDYPVIIATTLVYAVIVVIVNLAVDIIYGLLDPRARLSLSGA